MADLRPTTPSKGPAASRAVNEQGVGHPVLNLWRSVAFFAKMQESRGPFLQS
jgi:hypothetical protein